MIHLLCSGVLIAVQSRESAKGTTYVTGNLKTPQGKDGDGAFVSFVAFNDAVQAELLALKPGDGLSITGLAKLTQWTGKDGADRHGLSVVADRVLPNAPKPKPAHSKAGKPAQARPEPALSAGPEFADEIPF